MEAQAPLDSTFGTNGVSTINVITANHCKATDMQDDGKILCYYLSTINCFSDYIFRLMPNGDLDTSFTPSVTNQTNPKTDGVFYQSVSGSSNASILRQTSQGSIIWGSSGYCVRRLYANGQNDTAFGCVNLNAILNKTYSLYHLTDFYEDVAGGAYYIASTSWQSDTVIVAKILNTGVIDNSFGTNGALEISLPAPTIYGSYKGSIHFDNNGDLLVYGSSPASAIHRAALRKYDVSGNLVTSFGTNGTYVHPTSITSRFTHIAENQNGDIYAYGVSSGSVFTVKLNNNGVVDNSFGTGGLKNYSVTGNTDMFSVPKVYSSSLYNTVTNNISVNNKPQSYNSFLPNGNDNLQFGMGGSWSTSTNYRIEKMLGQLNGKVLAMGSDSLHPRILRYKSDQAFPTAIEEIVTSAPQFNYFNNTVQIKLAHSLLKSKASLFSGTGSLVYKFENNLVSTNEKEINLLLPSNLAKGVYIIILESKSEIHRYKFINY